jgi:hypothetical protein
MTNALAFHGTELAMALKGSDCSLAAKLISSLTKLLKNYGCKQNMVQDQ